MQLPSDIKRVLDDFVEKQVAYLGDSLQKVILYGSYARGDYTPESDVDIMLLTSETNRDIISKQLYYIFDAMFEYQMERNIEVNPNMQNIEFYNKWLGNYPYYDNIDREGIVLYERVQ